MAEESGKRVQGRSRFGWTDGVKEALIGLQSDDRRGWAKMRER